VIYDPSTGFTGGGTYATTVESNNGCRSKVDFRFLAIVIRAESAIWRLGVHWGCSNRSGRTVAIVTKPLILTIKRGSNKKKQ
jgi:hypothetical protein